MLTNKKYKSDKIIIPVFILLGISLFVIYFLTTSKGVKAAYFGFCITAFFGTLIYRYIKEKDRRNAVYGLLGLLFLYSIVFLVIIFK